jgi:hypothetical protein
MVKKYYAEYIDPTCIKLHGFEGYTHFRYWFRGAFLFLSPVLKPGEKYIHVQDDCLYDEELAAAFKKYSIKVARFCLCDDTFCSFTYFVPRKPYEIGKAEYIDEKAPAWTVYREPTIFYHGFIDKEDVGIILSVDRLHHDYLVAPIIAHNFRNTIKPFGDYKYFLTKNDLLTASKLFCAISVRIKENLTVRDKYIELSELFADAAKKYDCVGVTMSDLEDLERKGIL